MKKLAKVLSLLLVVAVLATSLCACSSGEKEDGTVTVKLGLVGEDTRHWDKVKENLAKDGIILEYVNFSEYVLPNRALNEGEIDLNAFQHYAYLNKEVEANGYELTVIGETIIAPLGLYSKKITDVSQIKEGDEIAIASDLTNGGRALKILEEIGLIEVDPAAGYTPSVTDITSNPLNLKITEVEAALTPSLLPDVTASFINGAHAVDNGMYPDTDAIYLETPGGNSDNPYVNVIVARTEDKDNETYKKIVEAYRTEENAQVIREAYRGAYIPAF